MSRDDYEKRKLEQRIADLEDENKKLHTAKDALIDFLQFNQELSLRLSGANSSDEIQNALDTTFIDSKYDMGLFELSGDRKTLTTTAFSINQYDSHKTFIQSLLNLEGNTFSFKIDKTEIFDAIINDQTTIYRTAEDLIYEVLPNYTAPLLTRMMSDYDKGVILTPVIRNNQSRGVFMIAGVEDTAEYRSSVKSLGMNIAQTIEGIAHLQNGKALSESLQKRNQELEALVDTLPVMYTIIDKNLRVVDASKRYIDTFADGAPLSSIVGKPCFSVYRGRKSPCPECAASKSLDTQTIIAHESNESETKKAGGPFIGYAIPLSSETGATDRVIEAVLDMKGAVATEQRFKALVEHMEEIFWIQDDGIRTTGDEVHDIVYVNPAFEEVTGFPVQALYEDRNLFLKQLHPDDRVVLHLNGRQEFRIIRADGEVRYMQAKTFPQHEVEGIRRTYGIAHDITDLKMTELSLKKTGETYQHLFDHSPVILFEEDYSVVKQKIDRIKSEGVTDLERYLQSHPSVLEELCSSIEIIKANGSALAFYGCETQDDLKGKTADLFDPTTNQTLFDRFIAIAKNETSGRIEDKQIVSAQKAYKVISQWNVNPGHEESYDRVIVSIIDQSRIYDVLHELSESQSRYRNLIHNAPIGIVTTDYQGNIIHMNDTFLAMTGYTIKEASTMRPDDFHPNEYQSNIREHFQRMLETGSDHHMVPLQHKEGHLVHIDLSAVVSEKDEWVTAYIINRSEKVLAQQEYEKAERILRHDLKNPIAGIMSVARSVVSELEGKEDLNIMDEYWIAVQQASTKAYNILQNQAISHKIATGKQDISIQHIDIEDMVNEIYESEFKFLLKDQQISFMTEYKRANESQPISYRGDYHLMSRLFSNMIGNAINASRRNDDVFFSAYENTTDLYIILHNERPIPKDLNESFFSHTGTNGTPNGEGFGKQIIKSIVDLHHGKITYTSDESSGTTFYVSLPYL